MSEAYLIWSNEHRAWWGPDECGYVRRLGDAGRYSRADALIICRTGLDIARGIGMFAELPVREDDVGEFLKDALVFGESL